MPGHYHGGHGSRINTGRPEPIPPPQYQSTGRSEPVPQPQYPHISHPEVVVPQQQPQYQERKNGARTYKLKVEQQPVRARMCGFGDKDRRPITPPPCIRLIVYDQSGRELNFNDIDSTYFVLMVDLWSHDGTNAVNLVRHSSAAPTVSISSSTTTSYPPPPDRTHYVATAISQYDQPYRQQPMAPQMTPYGHPSAVTLGYPYPPPPPPGSYPTYTQAYGQTLPQTTMIPAAPMSSNHTRNLIGMNAVNACRLNDLDGKAGFWFVLQDLSVRTEGTFRLKLSLFDIGQGNGTSGTVQSHEGQGPTQGKGPCLAVNFSDAFTVYSAKKFPGVIESTPLSKCFAQQGIKIPIRKDGPKIPNSNEYDGDD
ncbi:nucleoside diphosphatase Gda1 [Pyrenophora seminiperda CCB06]|uniref:Nucleoside diphosphatase Gda1 n=1 Tax=Pyrenophora seminiperda CCB06 TaxID=1302712 RepID=A0A3M7MI55_9PLEO|nr:nucleoside diphosphatase Gda1 [Pyrenophora seminiperda CCB06]